MRIVNGRPTHLLRVLHRVRYFTAACHAPDGIGGYAWAYGPWATDYYLTRSGRVVSTVERPEVAPLK